MQLAPPLTPLDGLDAALEAEGYAVLDACGTGALAGVRPGSFDALASAWEALPPDPHLRDGGRYRARRHASLVVDAREGAAEVVPHRAHFQPVEYNALHGGLERWFDPVDPAWLEAAPFRGLLAALATRLGRRTGVPRWFVEVHQFRIDTRDGIGRPTPEGAHRDGVDFVAVALVQRRDVRGGETRVFDARGPRGVRFTMSEPWSLLVLDDARVIHETTPIQPERAGGVRDTLVVTLRRGGFQAL
ncbi:MAG: 2OG-Fe dioxygenase family protein [Polyangiaceae bacterium]|nr:2OG-Fe dioxygenase family protein [Polyangiaceae bacterium]